MHYLEAAESGRVKNAPNGENTGNSGFAGGIIDQAAIVLKDVATRLDL